MPESGDLYVYPWLVPFSIDPEAGQGKIETVKHQKIRAALYVRVSTKDQAEGMSIPAQKRRLLETAAKKGWQIPEGCIYCEAVSAEALANRPVMLRVLREAESKKFDILLVADQFRLARNTLDSLYIANQLQKFGARIWIEDKGAFVNIDDKTGLFEFTVMGAVGTYDRMAIKDRCKQGIHQARISGMARLGGPPPYGWRLELKIPLPRKGPKYNIVVDEQEAGIVRDYLFGMPELSHGAIARMLNENGHRSKTDGVWFASAVSGIRRNRLYCGEYEYKGKIYKAKNVPAIITKKKWLETYRALSTRARGSQFSPKSTRNYLLTGIAFCHYCGSRYQMHFPKKPKGRKPYPGYYCGRKKRGYPPCTKSRWFSKRIIEDALINDVKANLVRPGWLELSYQKYIENLQSGNPQKELAQIRTAQKRLEKQRERIIEAIAEGAIRSEEARNKILSIRLTLKNLEDQAKSLRQHRELIPSLEEIRTAIPKIETADAADLQFVVRSLVEKVVFYKNTARIHYRFWPPATLRKLRPRFAVIPKKKRA